jgi:uncharacterized protein YbjQ (UPF0145 family)
VKKNMFIAAIVLVLLVAVAAWARETFLDLPVKEAFEGSHGEKRLDVPFYMAGEKHPKVIRKLGEFKTNKRTNAFNKSDREACQIAFLSGVIALQERARKEGGNAVIDVRSVTKHRDLESATDYRCVAGNIIANVVLMGTVVELEEKK